MLLPSFDNSISWNGVFVALGFLFTILAFKAKIDMLISLHTEQLEEMRKEFRDHRQEDDDRFTQLRQESDQRFNQFGERVFDLVSSVQRLIGQAEVRGRGDRRAQ